MTRQAKPERTGRFQSFVSNLVSNRAVRRNPLVLTILSISLLTIAVLAREARSWLTSPTRVNETRAFESNVAAQSTPARRGALNARLAVEPEVNRFRRRLGRRFLSEGRTATDVVGSLAFGSQRQTLRMTRSFNENGETVAIATGSGAPTLMWSDATGAIVNGAPATGETRAQIERLALDTPEQFVLAKLRGAVYQIIARNVRPSEAGRNNTYRGPVWDLLRVDEPQRLLGKTALSNSRLYYFNSATGLIERVLSRENGQVVTAEVSDWRQQGGETFPNKIVWRRNSAVLMELTINSVNFRSGQ